MSVLLVPSLNLVGGRPEVYVPYGLLTLEAAAHRTGSLDVEVAIFREGFWNRRFETSDGVVAAVLDELERYDFDVVGFSSVCSSVHYSFSIAAELKHRRPLIQVIFGGPYVTKLAEEVLGAFSFVDAVFVGEAELAFSEFCRKLRSGRRNSLFGIPGVITRLSSISSAPQIEFLDDLPCTEELPSYACWARLDLKQNEGKNFVPVEATRGCPLKCSFCSTRQVWGPRVRRKSSDRLLNDFRASKVASGVSMLSLIGDNVGVPRNQFLRFCEDLIERSSEFHWACSLKLDRVQESDLDTMWNAGCRGMFIGVETASADTLRKVNKAADLKREIINVEAAIHRGFLVETSFIIGFPWEVESDIQATFDLHCKILALGAKRSQIGILSPIPGTEIVEQGVLQWSMEPGTFSDDGVRLSDQHASMIRAWPRLFSHFARYDTPHIELSSLRAFQSAAAQVNGLHQRSRARTVGGQPFAGHEPDRTQRFAVV